MRNVFCRLGVWYDEEARSGAENMAIDQLLMEQAGELPILRVYLWSEPTVSFGYFMDLADAVTAFPDSDLTYVRRWTGGGVVDHRVDVTYTLVIPHGNYIAKMRGAESYCEIHKALAGALRELGKQVRLTSTDLGNGSAACFANPVAHDITNFSGIKVAGAGQRRNRHGLLHQGSVVAGVNEFRLCDQLAYALTTERVDFLPEAGLLDGAKVLGETRYATEKWLKKRR